MKLQHLAIIFVIIIFPISLIMGEYIHSQIDTLNLQVSYDNRLYSATYDAMNAFKMNTVNNYYSTISDSKLRDVEATIETFYNSLGQQMRLDIYTREDLSQFTPAVLVNLYDGYYIYSRYFNSAAGDAGEYQFGLKPYIYYTCRYVDSAHSTDVIVNYTLDNYITIYGKVDGVYQTKAGNLIDTTKVTKSGSTIKYDGIEIKKEALFEKVIFKQGSSFSTNIEYNYIIYKGNKVYKENGVNSYFYIDSNYNKIYYPTSSFTQELDTKLSGGNLLSDSAYQYYDNAITFTNWVNTSNLRFITQKMAVDPVTGNKINDFTFNTGDSCIFNCTTDALYGNTGITGTIFDINRMEVIRRTITTNLKAAISSFSDHAVNSSYEYVLPKFNEEDWYNITNNITMISFMQGLPIGHKYYNNYCVIVNNQNKELVTLNSLAVSAGGEMHLINCKDLIKNNITINNVYKSADFERKIIVTSTSGKRYFFNHSETRCYDCIINPSTTYKIDFFKGTIEEYDPITEKYVDIYSSLSNDEKVRYANLRQKVITALARERFDLYKINGYFSY